MSIPLTDAGHDLGDDRQTMCWRRTFPGHPEQGRPAREFTAYLLSGRALAGDPVSTVAEFVVNALRHTRSASPGGHFTVEVRRWPSGISIGLTDQGGTSEPAVREPDPIESGRGLTTVAALARHWDWTGGSSGRTVIAVFDRAN